MDEDGDVQFKSEGLSFFMAIDEGDPEYMRIVLPNIWSLDSNQERGRALMAADGTNRTVKVMKVFTARNNVWASIESFVASPKDFAGVFKRSLSAMQTGVMHFAAKMRSLNVELQNSSAIPSTCKPDAVGVI